MRGERNRLSIRRVQHMPARGGSPVDDEQQIGQDVFNELKGRVKVIATSPLYDVLRHRTPFPVLLRR